MNTSCAKNLETAIIPNEKTPQVKTYTMTVVAGKGEIGTKALTLESDGKTLNATWKQGDRVSVFNKSKSAGILI